MEKKLVLPCIAVSEGDINPRVIKMCIRDRNYSCKM